MIACQRPTMDFFNVEGILVEFMLEEQLFQIVECLFMNSL